MFLSVDLSTPAHIQTSPNIRRCTRRRNSASNTSSGRRRSPDSHVTASMMFCDSAALRSARVATHGSLSPSASSGSSRVASSGSVKASDPTNVENRQAWQAVRFVAPLLRRHPLVAPRGAWSGRRTQSDRWRRVGPGAEQLLQNWCWAPGRRPGDSPGPQLLVATRTAGDRRLFPSARGRRRLGESCRAGCQAVRRTSRGRSGSLGSSHLLDVPGFR